jgi:hypothetical protein
MLHRYFLFFIVLFSATASYSQVQVQGRVFDITKKTPLESVAVLSNSGHGAITDSAGHFSINVRENDTIYFSYQGKNTNKFAVRDIKDQLSFEISIHVVANELPGVTVKNRNYILDSIQNRKDYAKIFNYKKPGLKLSSQNGSSTFGVSVGFDLTELINMFRFKRNRQILSLQKRLIQQEQDKYIDKRFSRRLVTRLTNLKAGDLDTFMSRYRPTYEFLQTVNDLEFGYFVEQCFIHYNKMKKVEMTLPKNQSAPVH